MFPVGADAAGPELYFENNCLKLSALLLYPNLLFPEAKEGGGLLNKIT